MTLPPVDGKLFFELMWNLQYYVNQQRGFHANISSLEEYASLPTEKKLKARDELWKDRTLIEAYVRENPDALPAGELQIIHKWKNFIKGSFFILRHLKKGSIFIGNDNQVYVVLWHTRPAGGGNPLLRPAANGRSCPASVQRSDHL